MKHIIKISDIIGTEVRTRFSLNPLKAELKEGDEYLIDMQDVKMISRSAADELYVISHQYNVAMGSSFRFCSENDGCCGNRKVHKKSI